MRKIIKNISGFIFVILFTISLMTGYTFAEDESASTPQSTSFPTICAEIDAGTSEAYEGFPKCATSPAECGSECTDNTCITPINCLFLEEPIGGEPGYDLYKITCEPKSDDMYQQKCNYTLWHGEAIAPSSAGVGTYIRGPVQAILAYEPGKEYQGGLGLFYSYLGIIYKFMSGIIVGFVILVSIIGGIVMTTSGGNQKQFEKGKTMIIKSLIGMALWFLASVILYTINPTFFAF